MMSRNQMQTDDQMIIANIVDRRFVTCLVWKKDIHPSALALAQEKQEDQLLVLLSLISRQHYFQRHDALQMRYRRSTSWKRSHHDGNFPSLLSLFLGSCGRKCQPCLRDILCGPRRKKTHQSPRRPDERHPTFPILFNTNDFSLGTSVSLNIFDDLSIGTAFSVLDHLVARLLWLC